MTLVGTSVADLVESMQRRSDRLPFEIGAFVALEACEKLLEGPAKVSPADVFIASDGSISIYAPPHSATSATAAEAVGRILRRLLEAAGTGVPPLLKKLAAQGPSGGRWELGALRDDLEASLIPLNRAAARRVLARVLREQSQRPALPTTAPPPAALDASLDVRLDEQGDPPAAEEDHREALDADLDALLEDPEGGSGEAAEEGAPTPRGAPETQEVLAQLDHVDLGLDSLMEADLDAALDGLIGSAGEPPLPDARPEETPLRRAGDGRRRARAEARQRAKERAEAKANPRQVPSRSAQGGAGPASSSAFPAEGEGRVPEGAMSLPATGPHEVAVRAGAPASHASAAAGDALPRQGSGAPVTAGVGFRAPAAAGDAPPRQETMAPVTAGPAASERDGVRVSEDLGPATLRPDADAPALSAAQVRPRSSAPEHAMSESGDASGEELLRPGAKVAVDRPRHDAGGTEGSVVLLPDLDAFEEAGERRGRGGAIVLAFLLAVTALGVGVWVLRPDVFERIVHGLPEEEPEADVAAEQAARREAEAQREASYGDLVVRVTPARAQVLLFVGRGPALVENLPVGRAMEFVAITDGRGLARAVVPADAQFEGDPLQYELAMQTSEEEVAFEELALGPSRLPRDAMGEPRGSLGRVRVLTTPPNARVYMLVGFSPEVRLRDLPVTEAHEFLIYAEGHVPQEAVVGPSDWGGEGSERTAEVEVELRRR